MPKSVGSVEGFGPRLVSIRRQRGMTQYDLADALGVSQRAISYYESGNGHPQAAMLTRIAAALQVTTDDLLGSSDARHPLPTDNPESRRLWAKFRVLLELPDKDRRAVLHMLNGLAIANGKQTSNV